jgi:hypothetical protein
MHEVAGQGNKLTLARLLTVDDRDLLVQHTCMV